MDIGEYYRTLYESQKAVIEETCSTSRLIGHAQSHQFITDLETWIDILSKHEGAELLGAAKIEFQAGMHLLSTGHYKYAFIALRASLELALTAVEHSANLLAHLQWKNGRRDIIWAQLTSDESGVLSGSFCQEFAPQLVSEIKHINSLAKQTYRTCSEYVHGNFKQQEAIPTSCYFSEKLFDSWHRTSSDVRYVILFCLAMRFLNQASSQAINQLESCLQDQLSHISFVREVLAKKGV